MTFSGFFAYFQFSQSTDYCQKSRCGRILALCILLKKRLSYPYRCKDMIPLFARNSTELDLIFTRFYLSPHHHRLHSFLQPPYLQRQADAVDGKGAPLYNSFDFVDGAFACICRPLLNERVLYSQHTRVYGVKFQSVVLPNGLIINLERNGKTKVLTVYYELSLLI